MKFRNVTVATDLVNIVEPYLLIPEAKAICSHPMTLQGTPEHFLVLMKPLNLCKVFKNSLECF